MLEVSKTFSRNRKLRHYADKAGDRPLRIWHLLDRASAHQYGNDREQKGDEIYDILALLVLYRAHVPLDFSVSMKIELSEKRIGHGTS